MLCFHLLSRVPLVPPDPLWSALLLWRSWAARRILVHRVIVSLISVPCWARGSAAVARRILVISPESSHHQCGAVLVFARVKMCGHLPLVRSIKCPSGKHSLLSHDFPATEKWTSFSRRLSFPLSPSHREIGWVYGHLLSRRPFLFP